MAGPSADTGRTPVDHRALANALVDYDSDSRDDVEPTLRASPNPIQYRENPYRENIEAGISPAGAHDSLLERLDVIPHVTERIANYLLAAPLPQRQAAELASLGGNGISASIAVLKEQRSNAMKQLHAAVVKMRDDQGRVVPAERDAAIAAFVDITTVTDGDKATAKAFFQKVIDAWIADGLLSSHAVAGLRDFLFFNRIPREEMDAALRLAAIECDTDSEPENDEEDEEQDYFALVGHSNWPQGYRRVLEDRNTSTHDANRWFDWLCAPEDRRGRQGSRLEYQIWRNIVEREHDDALTLERLNDLDNTALPSHFGRALRTEWFETVLFDPVIAPYASSLIAIAERVLPEAYSLENVPFEWVRTGRRTPQFVADLLQQAARLAKVSGIAPMQVETHHYLSISPLFDRLLLDNTISEHRAQWFLTHFRVIMAALEESDVAVGAQCIALLLSAQWSDSTVSQLLSNLVAIGETWVLGNTEKLQTALNALEINAA